MITKIFPPLKMTVFVDCITAFLKGSNKELEELARKVMRQIKKEVLEKGLCGSPRMERNERVI